MRNIFIVLIVCIYSFSVKASYTNSKGYEFFCNLQFNEAINYYNQQTHHTYHDLKYWSYSNSAQCLLSFNEKNYQKFKQEQAKLLEIIDRTDNQGTKIYLASLDVYIHNLNMARIANNNRDMLNNALYFLHAIGNAGKMSCDTTMYKYKLYETIIYFLLANETSIGKWFDLRENAYKNMQRALEKYISFTTKASDPEAEVLIVDAVLQKLAPGYRSKINISNNKSTYLLHTCLKLTVNNKCDANTVIEMVKQNPVIGQRVSYVNYFYGKALLSVHNQEASKVIIGFIKNNPGNLLHCAAFLHLKWYDVLYGTSHYDNTEKGAKFDSIFLDIDRNARQELMSNEKVNKEMLSARLYYDAGMYKHSMLALKKYKQSLQQHKQGDNSTYYYRMGMNLLQLNKPDEALSWLQKLLQQHNGSEHNYMAPKVCLKLGDYYFSQNEYEKAALYFTQVSGYLNYPYKKAYDMEAFIKLEQVMPYIE